jgi:four helix bundle protein
LLEKLQVLNVPAVLAMSDAFTYRDLNAWKQAMTVAEDCYRCTNSFPAEERLGLTSQLRRAAVSIPANVAEGRCRQTTGAFINHVGIALGAVGELETCIELSSRLGFLKPPDVARLSTSVSAIGRLLSALLRSLESKRSDP